MLNLENLAATVIKLILIPSMKKKKKNRSFSWSIDINKIFNYIISDPHFHEHKYASVADDVA